MDSDKGGLFEELGRVKREAKELGLEKEQLKEEVIRLKQELEGLKSNRAKQSGGKASAEAERKIRELEKTNLEQKEELSRLGKEFRELQLQVTEDRCELNKVKASKNFMQQLQFDAIQKKTLAEQENQQLKDEIEDFENELDKEMKRNEELVKKEKRVEVTLQSLNRHIKKLQKDIEKLKIEKEAGNEIMFELEDEIKENMDNAQAMLFQNQKEQIEKKEARNFELREELSDTILSMQKITQQYEEQMEMKDITLKTFRE